METPTFIEIYPNALSSEFCSKVIELTDNICNRYTANNDGVGIVDRDGRKDVSIFARKFESLNETVIEVEKVLKEHWKLYIEKYDMPDRKPFLKYFDRTVKIQKSSAAGGFTQWHSEQGSTDSSMGRFGVWMFYLNDVSKGGTTDFKHYNLSVKPAQGTLLIWPASYTHVHRASPDLQEDKYIITGWFNLNMNYSSTAISNSGL